MNFIAICVGYQCFFCVGAIPSYVCVCSMLAKLCLFVPPKSPQTQCCIGFQRYCPNSRNQNFNQQKTNL